MSLPIEQHPSWEILDSTKLQCFDSCRRKFFYEYLLGWRLDYPKHDLLFGEAWHKGREYQMLYGYEDVEGAYNAFCKSYYEHFTDSDDQIYLPKTPQAALHGYLNLADNYLNDLVENEVVEVNGEKMIEVSGSVPIGESRILYYRMDSIMKRVEDEKIFSWDHKTTSGKYINSSTWENEFYLSIQNGTYTHCLYCLFPIDQVLGVEFYGVGFEYLKKGSKIRPAGYYSTFKKVPAFKSPDQMNTWLWSVNNLVDEIEFEMDRLSNCSENDSVMRAFPMRPKSCMDYRGCQYFDYCLAWQNPIQKSYEPPIGFKVEFWNPNEQQTRVRKNLNWE